MVVDRLFGDIGGGGHVENRDLVVSALREQPSRRSPGRWAGHAVGEAFQPLAGGTSVAFVGILGGLGAYALLDRDPALRKFKLQATVAIPLAVLDTALGDIHGVPYLAA